MGTFNTIPQFKFWCQKVLPLVYDESLSYYELLCKVVSYLNHVIADINAIPEYIKEVINDEHLEEYVSELMDELREQIARANEHKNETASYDRDKGELVWLDGKLARMTRDILAGDRYVEEVSPDDDITGNFVYTSVELEIKNLKSELEEIIGDLSELKTSDTSTLVASINELVDTIGDLSDLTTTDKSSIVEAINETIADIQDLATTTSADISDLETAINVAVTNDSTLSALNYGLKNDGTTINTNSDAQDFFTACLNAGKIAYFPAGRYKFGNTLHVPRNVTLYCDPKAVFDFSTSSETDGVVLDYGFRNSTLVFGVIENAQNGAGLNMYGTQMGKIEGFFITKCKYGIKCDESAENGTVSGNVVDFMFITQCEYGMYFTGTGVDQRMEQNKFKVHMINTCTYGIYFGPLAQALHIAYNTFEIGSIYAEPYQTEETHGIYAVVGADVHHTIFKVTEMFGGFTGKNVQMWGTANRFELTPTNMEMKPANFNVRGASCKYINLRTDIPSWYITAAAYNTQASWNDGNVSVSNTINIDFVIANNLSAGDVVDFYFYHGFAFGRSDDIWLTPKWASGALICTAIEDESVVFGVENLGGIPCQCHVRLQAVGSVTAGSYKGVIHYYG